MTLTATEFMFMYNLKSDPKKEDLSLVVGIIFQPEVGQ